MKAIKNIEEAKKYLNKIIYFIDTEKKEPIKLYIGGVYLFFNQIDYDITGFGAYEDKKCEAYWGRIEIKDIKNVFDRKDLVWLVYTFSSELAQQYLDSKRVYDKNRQKEYDIRAAKQLLDEQGVTYEIFD